MKTSVLFVCLGNICRSPTAHGVFQKQLKERKLHRDIHVDSAGTGAWHVGKSPDKRAIQAAAAAGYNLKQLRARMLVEEDFEQFSYILGMDEDNLAAINDMRPKSYDGHTGLLLDFADDSLGYREVPDPYYGGTRGFELVLQLVESACGGLLDHIQAQ